MSRRITRPLPLDPSAPDGRDQTGPITASRRRERDGTCAICGAREATSSVLCGSCAKNLASPRTLCPEQIVSTRVARSDDGDGSRLSGGECHALLIDPFGCPHLMSSTGGQQTTAHYIGRDPRCSLAIAEAHVSRIHARVEYREFSGAWFVKHESQRNHTRVADRVVEQFPMPIDSGHQITIGPVGFYFVELAPEDLEWAGRVLAASEQPGNPLSPSFVTQESLRAVLLRVELIPGGGVATAKSLHGAAVEVRLTSLEARFLLLLLERRDGDHDRSADIRGFVSSREILDAGLPFDTPFPTPDNLKALVRRVRRRFSSQGANDIIESQQGYGYRIQPSLAL